jgi:hypothetical protein
MNRGIAIKAGIILGFFAIVLGLAFGCSSVNNDSATPQISGGDDVFLSVGDVEITKQELWNKMKISDGVTYLEQYVEEQLLASYIGQVTQAMIDEKVEESIYGSNDPDQIADIQDDADLESDLILAYERTLLLQGLDPDNADDVRSFFELEIAKELYTREYLENLTDENDSPYFIDDEMLEEEYTDKTKGDVCALVIRFHSYDEAEAVMNEFNIVPNYEGRLGDYFGTTPIEDVLTANFNDTNTNIMTDEEALDAYIAMYNYMYGTSIDGDVADFCANNTDGFSFEYDDLTEAYGATAAQGTFANYLWNTLELIDEDETDDEIPLRFSITTYSVDDYELMVYKVEEAEVTAFEDLSQAELDALYEDVLENSITSSTLSIATTQLWNDHEFEIFDPLFKLQYAFTEQEEFDNNGSDTVVATLDNTEITADDLFDYMYEQIGFFYLLELVKQENVLYSDLYTDIYGDDYDYLNNDSDEMVAHRAELREMKSIFSSNGYAQYGFSSGDYTWEEFLVLAFSNTSEANVIRDLFVIGSLQPAIVEDIIAYENAADFIQKQVDDYFSLDATHLLLYRDDDFDFNPDEYNDYVDGLTGQDATDYNALMVAFENQVKSAVNNDDVTLTDIVNEFRDGLVGDSENDWADYKAAGFFIMTEDLSAQGSLTNTSTTNFDEDFVLALKRIYDDYVDAVDSDSTITEYVDDRLVQSNFGMHFIIATEGDDFDQPTAEFDATDTTYEAGFTNDSMVPSEDQINLYIQIRMAEAKDEAAPFTIPSDVRNAIEAYYGEIINAYFTSTGYTIATIDYIVNNNPDFVNPDAGSVSFLQEVLDILFELTFPEEFKTPAELAAE